MTAWLRGGLAGFVLGSACACASAQTPAQTPPPTSSAPLPAPLTSASKLFIGNAGDQENDDCLRAYNDLYEGLSALGKFQLVRTPADADLIFELHYEVSLGQAVASHDSNNSVRQFRVVLLDPATHVVLWSLTERTNYALRQVNRNKNLDETVSKLIEDLGQLLASQPPNNKSKIVHGPLH